jgi:transcriptional regulator with XRE-family HTH domain
MSIDESSLLPEERGWSQSDLAERLRDAGIEYASQSTVSRIEKGTRPVRMIEAQRLATIFDRPVHLLSHPDSREMLIHHASEIHKEARRDFVRFKDALRSAAEAQIAARDLLDRLDVDFGDGTELDPGTLTRLENLRLNMRQYTSMDLIAVARDIVYMAPETIEEHRGAPMTPFYEKGAPRVAINLRDRATEEAARDGLDQAAP